LTAAPIRVCLFGTFDSERHPRVRVLEEGLVAVGYDVVRCNEPWAATTADRVRSVRRASIAFRLSIRLVRAWWRLRRQRRGLGRVDVVVVGYLGVLDIHLAPVSGTLLDRGLATTGLRQRAAIAVDAAARRKADVVVVDTEEHRTEDQDVVVPVGASAAWFDARPHQQRRSLPWRCRIVFFGLYTPLQGVPTIARAITTLHATGVPVDVTMVGDGQDKTAVRDALAGLPNVTWRDWVPASELPALVADHDVCLGIFGTSPKARRVVPNKVFQGAAAGCAIVTSRTDPQVQLLGQHALYAEPGDAAALARQLAELATDRARCVTLQEQVSRLADDRFRPSEVVLPLDQVLRARL
jgi:glycosyltransferase involved in cell wall biosynthesis